MPIPVPDSPPITSIPAAPPFVGTFAFGETVVLLTASIAEDPYSEDVSEDWDAATGQDVAQVGVEPRPSSEPVQDARNAVTSGYTLYLPNIDVSPAQRFLVRGTVYNVLGEPAVWRNPFSGWAPGVVVQVERTEG